MAKTRRQLPEFISKPEPSKYLSDNYLVLDFEVEVNDGRYGSALDSRNSLYLSCYMGSSGPINCDYSDEFGQRFLKEAIDSADFIVAHNAKYELSWLARIGVDTGKLLIFDTQIAEYVLLGNLAAGDSSSGMGRVALDLDSCCIRRGFANKDPIVDIWMDHGVKVSDMPRKWVEDRCKQDVLSTRDLLLDQRRQLSRTNRLGVLYTRCLLTPVLAAIEAEGMHLDKERVHAEHSRTLDSYNVLDRELSATTGGINWRSSKQVAEYLYDTLGFAEHKTRSGEPKRTASGLRQTNKGVLDALRATTEPQRCFINLKRSISKVGSALDKSLNYFKEVVDAPTDNGIFTAQFNQCVTGTHRLSSTGVKRSRAGAPQFQNLPRSFKRLFSARKPDWLIGEADGINIEFRVAAVLGNDSQAKRDIGDPEWDAHLTSAAEMTQIPYEELREKYNSGDKKVGKIRQDAKSETFKPLYGGTKGTKAQERWYEGFRKRYAELNKTQEDWVHEVLLHKRLITPWGLRFYWPHARLSDKGYCNVGTAVYNYPIQALATAEIIPIAVTYFWHRVKQAELDTKIIPVNTVHDSLIAEIHPDYVDTFKELARQSFGPDVHDYLETVYKMDFDVALGCGIKVGQYWGEGVEEKFEYIHTERKVA